MVRRFLKNYFFLILAVLIAVFGYIHIRAVGNEYTYVRNDINSSFGITDISFSEDSQGKIEIISWEVNDSNFTARLRSVAPGRVYMTFVANEHPSIGVFYVHNNGVITSENFFGDCTGCKAVYVCILIYLALILAYLVVKYILLEKKNFYNYDNVLYLGLIIYAFFFIFAVIMGIYKKGGIYGIFQQAIGSSEYFVIFTFPIVIATTVFITISNIKLMRKEGRTWKNLLGVFLGLFLGFGAILPLIIGNAMHNISNPGGFDVHNGRSIAHFFEIFIESTIFSIDAYLECVLLGTIITGIKTAKHVPKFDKDFIIINGCQIRKDGTLTPLLQGRVDRAIWFAKKQKERYGRPIVFVPSGGKGSDEILSEAEAMKRYMLEQGISERDILAETKSTTTDENFKYSYELIRKYHGSDYFNVAFSTTNYHVFRSGLLASKHGIRIEGIGSKTKRYYWLNAFVREFAATIATEVKTHALVSVVLLLINLIGAILMYISEVVLF